MAESLAPEVPNEWLNTPTPTISARVSLGQHRRVTPPNSRATATSLRGDGMRRRSTGRVMLFGRARAGGALASGSPPKGVMQVTLCWRVLPHRVGVNRIGAERQLATPFSVLALVHGFEEKLSGDSWFRVQMRLIGDAKNRRDWVSARRRISRRSLTTDCLCLFEVAKG